MYSCDQCGSRFTRRFISHDTKTVAVNLFLPSKDLVRDVWSNDIEEQEVPRKRLLNNSAELNAGAYKTSKLFKNPKIQSLLDEIINDSSPENPPSTISQAITQNAPVIQNRRYLHHPK